jgi:hypothetical protein
MYPVTGASGGAILKPCDRIPVQLESREPCHNSCLFLMSLVRAANLIV